MLVYCCMLECKASSGRNAATAQGKQLFPCRWTRCKKCSKMNHFDLVCRSGNPPSNRRQQTNAVQAEELAVFDAICSIEDPPEQDAVFCGDI